MDISLFDLYPYLLLSTDDQFTCQFSQNENSFFSMEHFSISECGTQREPVLSSDSSIIHIVTGHLIRDQCCLDNVRNLIN